MVLFCLQLKQKNVYHFPQMIDSFFVLHSKIFYVNGPIVCIFVSAWLNNYKEFLFGS